jgi:biopolymer transport protein ExbB
MLTSFTDSLLTLMTRGGVVMWPLLLLSIIAVTLGFERCWFWLVTNSPTRQLRAAELAKLLRQGQIDAARKVAAGDGGVYGRVVMKMLDEPANDALAVEAVESQRPRIERFMPTLSTIITVAPMLGILGTVLGIISSFNVLAGGGETGDPALISKGIAEALLTTAAGLILAVAVLLPYNAFRAQVDRTLGRIDTLVAAAMQARGQDSRR